MNISRALLSFIPKKRNINHINVHSPGGGGDRPLDIMCRGEINMDPDVRLRNIEIIPLCRAKIIEKLNS